MQQVIKVREGIFVSKILQESSSTHLVGSKIILDFNPVLEKIKLTEGEFCLIHLKARPIPNKSLWRWGIYFDQEYYPVESWEVEPSNKIKVRSLELVELDQPSNPPTWVVCCENCTVIFDESLSKGLIKALPRSGSPNGKLN